MTQSEQIITINKYMNTANPRTINALKTQIEWKDYFNCLTWFDKHANMSVLVMANKFRNDFNDANTSFSGPTYLTIKQGSVGENVVQWQKILGFSGPAADGKFGPKTKAATVEWQRNHGLTPDGIVGPLTWTKALSGGTVSPSSVTKPPVASSSSTQLSSADLKALNNYIVGTTIKTANANKVKNEWILFWNPIKDKWLPYTKAESDKARNIRDRFNVAQNEITVTAPKPKSTSNISIKPPVSSKQYPPNTLHVGSRGAEVVNWQKVVGAKPDGIFGVNTEAATKEWQRKHNLSVTGYVTASDKAAATATPKMPPYIPPVVGPVITAASMVPTKVIEVVKDMPLWQKIAGGIVTSAAVFFGYKAYSKPTPKIRRSY